jgi:hypothetical protein
MHMIVTLRRHMPTILTVVGLTKSDVADDSKGVNGHDESELNDG